MIFTEGLSSFLRVGCLPLGPGQGGTSTGPLSCACDYLPDRLQTLKIALKTCLGLGQQHGDLAQAPVFPVSQLMAQCGNLSLIPGTHGVGGENRLPQVVP